MQPFVQAILERLESFFDPAVLGDRMADLLADGVVALVVFLAFYALWLVLRPVAARALERAQVDETGATFITAVLKYGVLTLGAINALGAVGIETSSLLASLGIAGLTIGFAARDAFSNIISGLLIFLDRPFVIGDLVEIEGLYGQVERITLRSTRIVTVDGKMLAVPNSDIINKTVASYTNSPHLRLDIEVTVGVEEDLDRVRRILLELIESDSDYLVEPPPRVVITQLNDYNVTVELQVWLRNEREHVPRRFELREAAFEALRSAGVEMPYETIEMRPLEVKTIARDRSPGTDRD